MNKKHIAATILIITLATLTSCGQPRSEPPIPSSSTPSKTSLSSEPTESDSPENNDSEMLLEAPSKVLEQESGRTELEGEERQVIHNQEDNGSMKPSRLDSVEQSLEPYAHLGIRLDRVSGLMMYDEKPVREIRDEIAGRIITESAGPNGFGGRDISGAIDLTVVYENDSPIGFTVSSQEEYDKNTQERSSSLEQPNVSVSESSQDPDTIVSQPIEGQLPTLPTPDPNAPLGSAENPIAREGQG
jgi:predicted small lipoprotein YifL